MMKEEEIIEKLKECIVEALGVEKEEITLDSSLIEDLGAESIDLLDLVFRLEQTFGIKISRGEIEEEARKVLKGEEFEKNGFLTPKAIEELKKRLPEVPPEKFKSKMKVDEIPILFTVRTFLQLVKKKLET